LSIKSGSLDFLEYFNFTKTKCENFSTTRITIIKVVTEHVLLKDDNKFNIFTNTLKDFIAHKET